MDTLYCCIPFNISLQTNFKEFFIQIEQVISSQTSVLNLVCCLQHKHQHIAGCRNIRELGQVSYIDLIENLNISAEMLVNEKLPNHV